MGRTLAQACKSGQLLRETGVYEYGPAITANEARLLRRALSPQRFPRSGGLCVRLRPIQRAASR